MNNLFENMHYIANVHGRRKMNWQEVVCDSFHISTSSIERNGGCFAGNMWFHFHFTKIYRGKKTKAHYDLAVESVVDELDIRRLGTILYSLWHTKTKDDFVFGRLSQENIVGKTCRMLVVENSKGYPEIANFSPII